MAQASQVMEYKCPCCGAGLVFRDDSQKLTCDYCDNTFDIEAVKAFQENTQSTDQEHWEADTTPAWEDGEAESIHTFTCPSCGGVLITEDTTAATFCPYCENPTVIPGRLSGGYKPQGVLPFQTSKEDAMAAFARLCKGKPLLPRDFAASHRLEKITGLYVPFWLYDCQGDFQGKFNATRVHTWSDAHYRYTRTDHYLLTRSCRGTFSGIPMDGSSKMPDGIMESIEPFDYGQLVDFDTAYLSGYFADQYDVEAQAGHERVRQRVDTTLHEMMAPSLAGYATAIPTVRNLRVDQGRSKYVLLPVWMLHTSYRGKDYTFAMNGQTGKMTGNLPICPKRCIGWFAGIWAASAALIALFQLLFG